MFHVKNVSDREITFVSETHRQDDDITVTDAEGNEINVMSAWQSGVAIDVRWNLKPGEVAKLDALSPTPNSIIKEPGDYRVKYNIRFNSRQSKDAEGNICLLYTSPSPRDRTRSRMPSSA